MKPDEIVEARPPISEPPAAYDPNNLHPLDEEDRKRDDLSEGIDWDEIIATTQADWEAGRYEEFDPSEFPTEDELVAALARWLESGLSDEQP